MEKEPKVKDDMIDDDDENEEEEEAPISEEKKSEELLNACKENNIEKAREWLAKGANPNPPTVTKDAWTALLWAACNGNE
jgi:ankyrin repeat protein